MKQTNPPLIARSFAKLNLYLKVLNKRKDKFHNLSTLFCRIDLADTIKFKGRNDGLIKISCNDPQAPGDKTNLCWQAAELLKRDLNLNYGLDIAINKRIPVGAGLGGGSSNAACVLSSLNRYWKLDLPVKKLASLGAKIGSDVAFFIYNTKFAEAGGRGEKIKPIIRLKKLDLYFVLIYPKIKISTPLIYQRFDNFSQLTRPTGNVKILTSELAKKGQGFDPDCLFNDLEIVAESLYPGIKQVKKAFSNIGLEKIMMSGSGSSVFSLCDSYQQAKNLSSRLSKEHKSWQVFVTRAV